MKFFIPISLMLLVAFACLCTAIIVPVDPFNADNDARFLGPYLNSHDLTNLLTARSGEQRVAIAQAYKNIYQKDLAERFNTFTNDYRDLLVAMVTPLAKYYAEELWSDIGFFAIESQATVDILMTSSIGLMADINNCSLDLYDKRDLETALNAKFRGLPWNVVSAAFGPRRNQSQEVDKDLVIADAKVMYKSGRMKNTYSRTWDDERQINEILKYRSFDHLHQLIHEYERIYSSKMETAFERWTFDDVADGAINMIKMLRSVPKYFAERLHGAMKGAFPRHRVLIRIIVGRSEIDLDAIKDAYEEMYKLPLVTAIKRKTSGEYQRTLFAIIDSERKLLKSEFC